jgi:hypothetical protein
MIALRAHNAARLPWPDGAPASEPMNVIMLTAEHTLDQIVVPRLIAAGADVSRVSFLKCIKTDERDQRQFLLAEDLDRLERLVQKIGGVGLITMDPISAYMGGKMDSHKATEVRAQLGPLKDFAERTNIALSTITHPAKGAGPRALDHFIGSQAFIAACRVGHLCVAEMEEKDGERVPTGRVLFTNVRNTAHKLMPTLAYRKEEFTVSTKPQLITAPRINWEGSVDITAEAAIAAVSGKKPDQQPKVQAFLREMLKDDKPVPQKEIEEAAAKKGFTSKQLRTAREKLNLESLAQRYLKTGKREAAMIAWIEEHLGVKQHHKEHIWRVPAKIVTPYAVSDIKLPLRIFRKQETELRKLDLWDLFLMESKLIPMLVAMHRRGVRIDIDAAERLCYYDRCPVRIHFVL